MSEQDRERAQAAELPEGDVVRVLLEQHALIRDLFAQVSQADAAGRAAAFDALRGTLAVHETAEEEVLRPVTRSSGGRGGEIADARMAEENAAKPLLARLENIGTDDPEFLVLLEKLQAAVFEHAEHEETEEFPLILAERGETMRRAMGTAVRAAEAVAPTHPHPSARTTTINLVAGPFVAVADRARDVLREVSRRVGG